MNNDVASDKSAKDRSNFLDALNGINKKEIPVWFMRQAGRYLPEYQMLRKQYDFRTMSHTPKLICEVTLQPLKRFELDAAILFSDILTCLEFMGAPFKFEESGPHLASHGPEALKQLSVLDPEKSMSFVGEGIDLICNKEQKRPLIGFVGAPFTLASYLIEGGTSREFSNTRKMMLEEPEEFRKGLNTLADSVGRYLLYQIRCGAKAIQVFDSWVGILSLDQYVQNVLPAMQNLFAMVRSAGVPMILYSQPTFHLLPALAQTGATTLSVDWRRPISQVWAQLQPAKHSHLNNSNSAPEASTKGTILSLQGNLDPLVTTLPWSKAKGSVSTILEDVAQANLRKQFVFNVGHGVTPETRVDTIEKIIQEVHSIR